MAQSGLGVDVVIVKAGYLNKQGGARGGRKNWKRRWFVLKEDCLYYYSTPECVSLLGVMPIHGSIIFDLEAEMPLTEPPAPKDEKVCHECKKLFSLTVRKHNCKHCGSMFCGDCTTKTSQIPKFGIHEKVKVCDQCHEIIRGEMEASKLLANDDDLSATKNNLFNLMSAPFGSGSAAPGGAGLDKRNQMKGRKFTLPTQQKPHLFAVKNSERELWIQADTGESRIEWVNAIRAVQNKQVKGGAFVKGAAGGGASLNDLIQQSPNWEIDFSAVSILNRVGVGAFGEVYRARLWGTEIAVKTLKTEELEGSDKVLEELKKEVSILAALRHPNIVLYIGACTKPPNVCILTEWCGRGSLYDVLHDHSNILTAKLILDIAMGIAQGMNYLHSLEKRIIHRDLKSHNVLLTKSFQVKVADFGLSHVREGRDRNMALAWSMNGAMIKPSSSAQPSGRHYGIFGTPEWMAPEVMEGAQYTEKIDVYSFGILLSELLTRQMPFHDIYRIQSYMDVVEAVLDNAAIPTIPKWCENFLKPLILECLSRNPKERPSFTDIILKLREFAELEDSIYFYQFDIPRIREMMANRVATIQALAAKEIWQMVKSNKIKRTSDNTGNNKELTSSSSWRSPKSSNATDPRYPGITVNATSPVNPKKTIMKKSNDEKEQGPFQLDDDDAAALEERFVALLYSPHSQVQLWSCKALSALLRCCDTPKRAQDREFLISEGAMRPLLNIVAQSSGAALLQDLQKEAGELLLLLSSDVSSFDSIEKEAARAREELRLRRDEQEKFFTSLHLFGSVISDDIRRLRREKDELDRHIKQKLLLASCVTHAIRGDKMTKEEESERVKLMNRKAYEKRALTSGGSSSMDDDESSANSVSRGAHKSRGGKGRPRPLGTAIDSDSDSDSPRSPMSPVSTPSSPIGRRDPMMFQKNNLAVDDTNAHLARVDSPHPHGYPRGGILLDSPPSPRGPYLPETATASPSAGTPIIGSGRMADDGDNVPPPPPPDDDETVMLNKPPQGKNNLGIPGDKTDRSPSPGRHATFAPEVRGGNESPNARQRGGTAPTAAFFEQKNQGRTRKYTGADKEKFILLEQLLQIIRSPSLSVMPLHFSEYYSSIVNHSGYLLRYEGNKDTWQLCYAVLLETEMRVFDDVKQEADAPSVIIHTKSSQGQASRVRTGTKHGLVNCFSLEDCGDVYTFCCGTAEIMDVWKDYITVGADKVRALLASGGDRKTPSQEAAVKEKLRSDIPLLRTVPQHFAKHFPHISHHGYLMISDKERNEYKLHYFILVGPHLRIYESHKANPTEIINEFDVDSDHMDPILLEELSERPSITESTANIYRRKEKSPIFSVKVDGTDGFVYDLVASNVSERDKWLVAILGEEGLAKLSQKTPSKILPFIAYYSHVDYYGILFRKRKYSNRWVKEFFLLVDSEIHYYISTDTPPDQPRGTFYACTNSGKPFPLSSSSKRPYCFSIQNPHRTYYLAAESEREYLGWINAIKTIVNSLSERQSSRKTF